MKLVAKNGAIVVDNLEDLAKYLNTYEKEGKKVLVKKETN